MKERARNHKNARLTSGKCDQTRTVARAPVAHKGKNPQIPLNFGKFMTFVTLNTAFLGICPQIRHITPIMSNAREIAFRKMNGLGNDFVIVDIRSCATVFSPETVRAIADRTSGIGCDQFILIEPARDGGDCFMGIRNADGGEVEACGNAARCVVALMMEETGKKKVIVETLGGTTVGWRAPDGNITVDMGVPRLKWQEIPLSEEIADTRGIE